MRLVTHISSVWNDICGYDAIPLWYEMTIVGMMTYQGVWNDMFWYETTLVYNDMYWYELIPLRYEMTCTSMNWYLYGMKWQLLVWWHTKGYEMKLIWYEMTIWWYEIIPFLDRVWWHTIWYEFFECFFLMRGVHGVAGGMTKLMKFVEHRLAYCPLRCFFFRSWQWRARDICSSCPKYHAASHRGRKAPFVPKMSLPVPQVLHLCQESHQACNARCTAATPIDHSQCTWYRHSS